MRKFTGKTLLVATHNQGKLEEVADPLNDFGIDVVGAAEKNLPEPEETGTTFVENARIKAHAAAQATGLPALSDDSGIEIDALDGAPGGRQICGIGCLPRAPNFVPATEDDIRESYTYDALVMKIAGY